MNHKFFTPEDEKSPLSPFKKGGFKKSPFLKGEGILIFTVSPAATNENRDCPPHLYSPIISLSFAPGSPEVTSVSPMRKVRIPVAS